MLKGIYSHSVTSIDPTVSSVGGVGVAYPVTPTIDLRFFSSWGRSRFTRRFGELLPGVVIIEVKSAAGDEVSLPGFLAPLRVRASRFSKYVVGCQRFGYLKAG